MTTLTTPRRWLVLCALSLLAACASRTEIVVGVASDLPITKLDGLRMRVTDSSGHLLTSREWPLSLGSPYHLPAAFGVGVSATGDFIVHVEGTLHGQVVVSRHSQLTFVNGKTLFIRLALIENCYGDLDGSCAASTWCTQGVCRPLTVDPNVLPDYQNGDENRSQCGEGLSLGLTPPPALDCPAGQECVDSVCYLSTAPLDGPLPNQSDLTAGPEDMTGMTPLDLTGVAMVDGSTDAGLNDLPMNVDLPMVIDAAPDFAPPPPPPDLTYLPDFVPPPPPPDFFGMTLDLVVLPDLTVPDLAVVPDLTAPPPDQAVAPVPDQAILVDLVPGPDLLPPPPPSFEWESPLPQGAQIEGAFYDGSSANQTGSALWLSTYNGDVIRYDDNGKLIVEKTYSNIELRAIYAHGAEVWAVGHAPLVLHRGFDGAWHNFSIPSASSSMNIWRLTGDGQGGVVALTTTGQLVRADSSKAFQRDVIPPINSPKDLWGGLDSNGKPCLIVVGGGVANYDPQQDSWTVDTSLPQSAANATWHSVRGCGDDGTTIAGATSTNYAVSVRKENGSWVDISPSNPPQSSAVDSVVTVSSSEAYAWLSTYSPTTTGPLQFQNNWIALNPVGLPSWSGALPLTGGADPKGNTYLAALVSNKLYEYNTNSTSWAINGSMPMHMDGRIFSDGANNIIAPSGRQIYNAPEAHIWYTKSSDDTTTAWKESTITATGLKAVSQVFGLSTGNGNYKYYAAADNGAILSSTDPASGFGVEYQDLNGGDPYLFSGVWAADTNNVYAVANEPNNGFLCRIYGKVGGAAWKVLYQGGQPQYRCTLGNVFGFSASEVYVGAGLNGSPSADVGVLKGSGTTWTNVFLNNIGVNHGGVINDVWGASNTDLWAVGSNNGILMVYHQTDTTKGFASVTFPSIGSSFGFQTVLGTAANDVWAIGDAVFHWDGKSWVQWPVSAQALSGLAVDSKHVWVGGYDNVFLLRR